MRANYNNLTKGVHEMMECLELFLWNLLLGEKNELRNRTMHINGKFFVAKKRILDLEKRTLGPKKQRLINGG